MPETSVAIFEEKNPKREGLIEARDGRAGFMMYVDALIFGFLLFSPCLALLPKMENKVIVLVLWVIILLIMWSKIEYNHRCACWYICLNRGIILDFPKTHTPKGWLLQLPTLFALTFVLSVGIVIYIGLDPDFEFDSTENALSAVFAILGVLFVFTMTKAFVDLEGAPTLSVNMLAFFCEDPEILKEKGYKLVKMSDLQDWMLSKKKEKGEFSWDEIHGLSDQGGKPKGCSLVAGFTLFYFIKPHKDSSS